MYKNGEEPPLLISSAIASEKRDGIDTVSHIRARSDGRSDKDTTSVAVVSRGSCARDGPANLPADSGFRSQHAYIEIVGKTIGGFGMDSEMALLMSRSQIALPCVLGPSFGFLCSLFASGLQVR